MSSIYPYRGVVLLSLAFFLRCERHFFEFAQKHLFVIGTPLFVVIHRNVQKSR